MTQSGSPSAAPDDRPEGVGDRGRGPRTAGAADNVTRAEAARILAVHVGTVDRLIRRGMLVPARRLATAQLSRSEVERLALSTRTGSALIAGGYWVSRSGAAELLQRSERRVQQLSDAGRLPFEIHEGTGWRLYRCAQVEVIGRARRARFGGSAPA